MATARKSDPATSHLAAPGKLKRQTAVEMVVAMARKYPGSTANELAAFAVQHSSGIMSETVRKRVREAVEAGTLKERPARQCTVSGHQAATFVVK